MSVRVSGVASVLVATARVHVYCPCHLLDAIITIIAMIVIKIAIVIPMIAADVIVNIVIFSIVNLMATVVVFEIPLLSAIIAVAIPLLDTQPFYQSRRHLPQLLLPLYRLCPRFLMLFLLLFLKGLFRLQHRQLVEQVWRFRSEQDGNAMLKEQRAHTTD